MTKTISYILLLLAACGAMFGQNAITSTTLSGTITSSATTVCVASATSIVLPSLSGGNVGSIFVIDQEAMQVIGSGPTSTCFRVKRGLYANSMSNSALGHGTGAKVWVLGATLSTGDPSRPISTAAFLTQRPFQAFELIATPTLFGVAASSTTDVSGKISYGAIEVDVSTIVTGACLLNGATVTTDKHILALWDNTGTLLATSALAGLADSGASVYQCQAFTSPIALPGPAQYYVGNQSNGTTDNFQTYAASGVHSSYPTGVVTGGSFGVIPNVPVSTTFTAGQGPLMVLY